MKKFFTALVVLLSLNLVLQAQENLKYVTYGNSAKVIEGDNDYKQNIFIKIPESLKDTTVTVWGFDLDTGGENDFLYGAWNTSMTYNLFAGSGVYTGFNPADEISVKGAGIDVPVQSFSIGEDAAYNNKWKELFSFDVDGGEYSDGFYYFRIEVAGVSGDDANSYDFMVGFGNRSRNRINNVEIFGYFITTRLDEKYDYASIRFNAPENSGGIILYDFDAGGADLKISTPYRTLDKTPVNNQGSWSPFQVNLLPEENGKPAEIMFGKGGETPNDATFYITDSEGNYIPLSLPPSPGKFNNRPVAKYKITPLADCYSIVFDAEESSDPDGERITFFWDFGDGTTATGARKVHKYEEQREYNVKLIITDNSGAVSNSVLENFSVKVNRQPVASAGDDLISYPGENITFDASDSYDEDGNIIEYKWDMGDGTHLSGKTVTYSYKAPGVFNVRLTVTDDAESPCNTGTDEVKVVVNAAPVAVTNQPVMSATGEKIDFTAAKSYDPDGEIIRYSWDFGDGNSAQGINVSHTYNSPGSYEVMLIVADNSNVTNSVDTTYIPLLINDPPVAEAGNDRLVAVDEIFVINGEGSKDNDGRIISYEWDFGDGNKGTGYSVAHSYAVPGKYKVKLLIRDDSNTKGNIDNDSLLVTVNARPNAVAGDDIYATYGRIEFDASESEDSDGEIISYEWDFGDGSRGTGIDPAHIYSAPGDYEVKLRVTDNTGVKNNFHEDYLNVRINRVPLADAGPDEITSPGADIVFDGSNSFDTDGDIVSYEWDFGDGNNATGEVVNYSYDTPGKYSVTLKVTDNSGHESAFDIDSRIITVNSAPVPFAGADRLAAPEEEIEFDAGSSYDSDGEITEYLWDFSDGESYDEPSFSREFDEPGTYYGYLTIRDNAETQNSAQYDTVVIRINSTPVAKAGTDIFTCENIITFDGSASADVDGDALSYYWDFGDGTPVSEGKIVTHNFREGGTYPVTLTVNDNNKLSNSEAFTSIVVKINQKPKAVAGEDMIVCAGETTIFNASESFDPEGGVLLYKWDFGDGTTAEGLNPTKNYKKGGVYEVTLTVEDDSGLPCNSDTDKLVVEVVESPVANAGNDMIICANTEVKFDGTKSTDFDGVVNSYEWNFGDGGTGGGAKPTYIYEKAGVYVVTLTITGDLTPGCDNSDSDEITVTVIEAPVAIFEMPEKHPVNSELSFDGSESSGEGSTITSYTWDFGDGTIVNGARTTHTYTKSGNYFVTLEITTDSETRCNNAVYREMITINDSPLANAGADITASVNIPVGFDGRESYDPDGVIKNYTWDFGDGSTFSGVIANHQYSAPGKYRVILTVEDNTLLPNNSDKDTLEVFVNSVPVAVISAPDVACAGEEFNLSASQSRDTDNNIVAYKWYFPDGTMTSGEDISHKFEKPGNYNVRLEVVDNSGAIDSIGQSIKLIAVNQSPLPVMHLKTMLTPGEEFEISGEGTVDPDFDNLDYEWDLGDGTVIHGKNSKHSYASAGTYTVKLKVNDGRNSECSVTELTREVKVNSAPSVVVSIPANVKIGPANNKVLLSASGSKDTDGDALTFTWEFEDGTVKEGAEVFYEFTSPGTYTVKVSVDDGQNALNSVSFIEQDVTVEMLETE